MPSANPVEAGRKGGRIGGKSRSAAKLAACRRNGFQKQQPQPENLPANHAPISELKEPDANTKEN